MPSASTFAIRPPEDDAKRTIVLPYPATDTKTARAFRLAEPGRFPMTKYLLLVGASALALTSGTASANGLRPALGFKHEPIFRVILPHRGATVLYDQSEGDVDFGVL